jgi:hypothetical protein
LGEQVSPAVGVKNDVALVIRRPISAAEKIIDSGNSPACGQDMTSLKRSDGTSLIGCRASSE